MTEETAKRLLGLREERRFTFREIAEVMGYSTRERARQNYCKAKRRLGEGKVLRGTKSNKG